MTSGFGTGHCWYYGRDMTAMTTNVHRFLCKNVGAVASGAKLALAF